MQLICDLCLFFFLNLLYYYLLDTSYVIRMIKLILILANNPTLFFPDRCLLHFTYLLCLLLIHLHPNLIVDIFACFLFDIRLCILKRSRSSVVVIEREQFKTVSHAVWVCWKAVTTEKIIKKNESIRTILTIITTIIVHNDNYNYIAPASLLIYLPAISQRN